MNSEFLLGVLILGLTTGSVYASVALGYSLTFGVMRFINVAHGEFFAIGGYLAYSLVVYQQFAFWAAILLSALIAAALAALVERFGYRPIGTKSVLLLLVASVGVSVMIRSALAMAFGDQAVSLPALRDELQIPTKTQSEVLVLAWNFIALVVLWLVIRKSRFGWEIRATAEDREAADALGINTSRLITIVFAITGLCAGAAGALASSLLDLTPTVGIGVGVKSFIAAVVGGIGNLAGTVFVATAVGILEALLTVLIGSQLRDVGVLSALILAVVVRHWLAVKH